MAWTYNLNERRNQNGQSKASRQWGLGTMLVNQTANGRQNGEYQKFKIYRLVNLGKVNNGVFGSDQAFLTENDAGAYLSMKPFPVCQSPYYLDALNDIILHLKDLYGSSKDQNERGRIKDRWNLLLSLMETARENQNYSREDRQNVCLLELLDYWFNCSNTLYIDNYMQKLEELINGFSTRREDLKIRADNINKAFQEEYGTDYKTGKGKKIDYDNLMNTEVINDGLLIKNFLNKYKDFCDKLKRKLSEAVFHFLLDGSDKYVDDNSGQIVDSVKTLTNTVDEELKRMDGKEIRVLINKYQLAEEYQQLYLDIKTMKQEFAPLLKQAQELKENLSKQAVVTENSYLMCRCGGKIEILDGGQWVDEVDLKVKEDIENVLLFAEEKIHSFLKSKGQYADEPVTEDWADTRYSVIIALNGIHLLLKSMGRAGKYMDIPDSDYVKKYYPLPNISIDLTPQNEKESEEHRKAVVREASAFLPFGLNWIFKVLFLMEDMSNAYSTEESRTMKEVAKGIAEDLVDEGKEQMTKGNGEFTKEINTWIDSDLGKTASFVDNSITWYNLLHDLMTTSYALFIGEIKIEINTGWDKYTFKGNYDGNGNRKGEIEYKKDYLGKDMFTNLGYAQYDFKGENYSYHILEGGDKK